MRLYIAKAEVPVGTVHTWADGKQHQKVAPDKWEETPQQTAPTTPQELWGTLKPGDYATVGSYVWKVKERHADGTTSFVPKGGIKVQVMRLNEAGKVERRMGSTFWGYGSEEIKPYVKPTKPDVVDRLPPPRPANPHPVFDQTTALFGAVQAKLRDLKGPKVERLLDGFSQLVHQAAALGPEGDGRRVEWNAQNLKQELRDYLYQRQQAATRGARQEQAASRTAEEQAIAKPTNTPTEDLPRPDPPAEVAADPQASALWQHLLDRRIVDSYTIGDYPIGRGYRGQLKVWVAHTPGRGWRVMTQTTNRGGGWNKPHGGTYSPARVMVVEPQSPEDRGVLLYMRADGNGAILTQVRGQPVLEAAVGGREIIGLAKQRWVSDSVAAGTEEELKAQNAARLAEQVERAKGQFLNILRESEYRFNQVVSTADPDRLGSQKRRSHEKAVALLRMWGIGDDGRPKRDDAGRYYGKLGEIERFLRRHGHALPGTPEPVQQAPKVGAERQAELRKLQDAKPAPRLTPGQRDLGQFMTPHPIAYQMAELGNVKGLTVLDPTAGEGRLLKYAQELGADTVHGFEVDGKLAKYAGVPHQNFLDVPDGQPKADVLLMNPPFTVGGPSTQALVDKAIQHHWTGKGPAVLLLPVGRTGEQVLARYRNLVVREQDLPDDAFKNEGTHVRTRLYVLKLSHRDQLGPVQPTLAKSLFDWDTWLDSLIMEKAGGALPVGTVRVWRDGKRYQKLAPGKWEEAKDPKKPLKHVVTREVLRPEMRKGVEHLRKVLARLKPETREGLKRVWVKGAQFGLPHETQAKYARHTDQKGRFGQSLFEYQPDRKRLHDEWVRGYVDSVKAPPPGELQAIVMMGGGGSGKGTIKKAILGGPISDYVNIDPDDIKEKIPEYRRAMHLTDVDGKMVTAKDAAIMAHEESSDVANHVLEAAIAGRKKLVLDGTGANASKYASKVQALKDAGYHVTVVYAHVEKDEAIKRAKKRAQGDGRYVPMPVLQGAHDSIPRNFQHVAATGDSYLMYYSDQPPKLMISGPPYTVGDSAKVGEFEKLVAKLGGHFDKDGRVLKAESADWLGKLQARIAAYRPESEPKLADFDGRGGIIQVDPDFVEETRRYLAGLPEDAIVDGGLE